jgi:hypothetical protein
MKILTGPSPDPALPGYCPFLANLILPVSYQPYPLPARSQFTVYPWWWYHTTQMGVTRVSPVLGNGRYVYYITVMNLLPFQF